MTDPTREQLERFAQERGGTVDEMLALYDGKSPFVVYEKCRGGEGGHPCSLWPNSPAGEGETGSEIPCSACSEETPAQDDPDA